ncbi:ATP-binding protein [Streptomyces sp. NPDC051776]|uniref:ATP-binding protein n=1 Tax=Streptomyces sp. NPDC051776 TaxID=3155414 RepID=UPI00341F7F47
MHVTWELSCTPQASAHARALVGERLEFYGLGELAENALVVTSEMVTNAVRHGTSHSGVDLALQLTGDAPEHCCVHVVVRDHGPGADLLRLHHESAPSDVLAASGRGLVLIEELAQAWGDTNGPDGHTVWACLRCERSGQSGRAPRATGA